MDSELINVTNHYTINATEGEVTEDGFYISRNPVIAKEGVCITYTGAELRKPDKAQVVAYRKPGTFTGKVLNSFKMLPVTLNHPMESKVNSENAKREVVGATSSDIKVVNGSLCPSEVVIYDKDAVKEIVDKNSKEVSIGFTARHIFEPGVTPQGEHYDCIEEIELGNHLSLLKNNGRGKGGADVCLNSKEEKSKMTELVKTSVNGVEVEMTKADSERLAALEIKNAANETHSTLNSIAEKIESLTNSMSELKGLKESLESFVNEYKEDMKGKEKKEDKEDKEDAKETKAENKCNSETVVETAPVVNSKKETSFLSVPKVGTFS